MTVGRAKLRGCLYHFRDANQEELDALSPNCLSCFLYETSLQNTKPWVLLLRLFSKTRVT